MTVLVTKVKLLCHSVTWTVIISYPQQKVRKKVQLIPGKIQSILQDHLQDSHQESQYGLQDHLQRVHGLSAGLLWRAGHYQWGARRVLTFQHRLEVGLY